MLLSTENGSGERAHIRSCSAFLRDSCHQRFGRPSSFEIHDRWVSFLDLVCDSLRHLSDGNVAWDAARRWVRWHTVESDFQSLSTISGSSTTSSRCPSTSFLEWRARLVDRPRTFASGWSMCLLGRWPCLLWLHPECTGRHSISFHRVPDHPGRAGNFRINSKHGTGQDGDDPHTTRLWSHPYPSDDTPCQPGPCQGLSGSTRHGADSGCATLPTPRWANLPLWKDERWSEASPCHRHEILQGPSSQDIPQQESRPTDPTGYFQGYNVASSPLQRRYVAFSISLRGEDLAYWRDETLPTSIEQTPFVWWDFQEPWLLDPPTHWTTLTRPSPSSMSVLWALAAEEGSWILTVRSDFDWLYGQISGLTSMPCPRQDPGAWHSLILNSFPKWKGVLRSWLDLLRLTRRLQHLHPSTDACHVREPLPPEEPGEAIASKYMGE